MEGKYANICVDISHEKVDRPFQYKIPEKLQGKLEPGMQVLIPFGRGNKQIKGFVLELTDDSQYPDELCKEIVDVVEGGISAEGRSIALASWMRANYGSTLIAALKTVLPVKEQVKQTTLREIYLNVSEDERKELIKEAERKHHVAKQRLLEAFAGVEALSYGFVTMQLGVSAKTLQAMEKQGILRIESQTLYRNPVKVDENMQTKIQLSEKQQEIVDAFCDDYKNNLRKTYLLHGITGSGKTEVYMEMIAAVIAEGKEAIVLIPEIALTYQTVLRFYRRFGDRISVIHSKLSKGERFDQFERAKRGEIQVMIGPRSALFTPFNNLGLIIIDEEHEGSYKSDGMPKYHARETAEYVALQRGASLVLGSATPSVTAYYKAQKGQYGFFRLQDRFGGRQLPTVHTVDLREELHQGNRSMFSRLLYEKMKERLEKKEQIMLFLNRRGYAGFVTCRSCGYVAKCPHCDVSLTEHGKNKLVCHYCGYETPALRLCPECGSKYIAGFKVGTEQVEERIKVMFPAAKVLRMDGDTTKRKDDYEKILSAFAGEEADILIGTQMIVKGHDFPGVTLVGVLAADLSLSAGDYRAAERTFQLLTQAVGRAGRGKSPGEAVIQTYRPEHYAIVHAADQDYEGFYEEEIAYREVCGYPPVKHMLAVLLTSENESQLTEAVNEIAGRLRDKAMEDIGADPWSVIGPADAVIGRISDSYRKMIYIRHGDYSRLVEAKDMIESMMEEKKKEYARCTVYFDFDPMSGY
ncbi:MAG: primosomal protein N' [Lachnospiraceae bacterium]|nr:primosomal protein N' [Lachnospiraceae bacterium]